MTQEYAGPGNAFILRFPDDWTFDRSALQSGELDSIVIHKTVGAIGALRLTAWAMKDGPGVAEKFIARTRKLYAKPLREEMKIYDWIPLTTGNKSGFIRASMGTEDGIPVFITVYVVAARKCAIMGSFVVPVARLKTTEEGTESKIVSQMIFDATLT